jgi:hypothetical protein
MKLTENFTLDEFTKSTRAEKAGIENVPGEIEINNILVLCQKVLQPIRNRFGKAVTINSGFRNDELNDLVGGEDTSQHLKGEAADFYISEIDLKEIFLYIIRELKFDQVIYEDGRWIHVSYRQGKNRNQKLVGHLLRGDMVYKPYVSIDQLR